MTSGFGVGAFLTQGALFTAFVSYATTRNNDYDPTDGTCGLEEGVDFGPGFGLAVTAWLFTAGAMVIGCVGGCRMARQRSSVVG